MFRKSGLCCFLVCVSLAVAQDPVDGFYEVDKLPWNGSYLPTTRDQLVHGELYRLYPGPLPKLFRALGLDPQHPGIDTELLHHVDRDAPRWFGSCNGWAVSAIKYEEPTAIVVNGIKFFPGELKAFLAGIYKANTIRRFGVEDSQYGGLTADSVEALLYDWIANRGQAIIFDEDISNEVWNYPVAAFTRESTPNGEWTDVNLTIHYSTLIPLNDVVGEEAWLSRDIQYFYRYRTASKTDYQWVGPSIGNHPQRAWLDRNPYHVGAWLLNSNHFYHLGTYDALLAKAAEPDHMDDLFEPNPDKASAHPLGSEFLMGSLPQGDEDFYQFALAAGESLDVNFKVYDGDAVAFSILGESEADIYDQFTVNKEEELQILFTAPADGAYYFKVARTPDAFRDSFYQFVFDEDVGAFEAMPGLPQNVETYEVMAINTRDRSQELTGAKQSEMLPWGSLKVTGADANSLIRTSGRTVWAETTRQDSRIEKRYHRDHVFTMPYAVPHFTLKNGWDTALDVRSAIAGEPVWLHVYNRDGLQLEQKTLTLDAAGRFQGSLALQLSKIARQEGAWFELKTTQGNRLQGTAQFVSGLGPAVVLDIQAAPRIGELLVFDLKSRDVGSTGVSLVNTSGLDNELLYRLVDQSNNEIADGFVALKPGQKWLTSVASLSEQDLGEDLTLFLHVQYPVDGMVIQFEKNPFTLYGHRILSVELDQWTETYIALPENRDWSQFVFANYNSRNIHVLFEGYAADGSLQGRFNIELGKPLLFREVRRAPLTQILENGVSIKDLDAITHFRVTTVEPIYAFELIGEPGIPTPMVAPLVNIYENP